jgi:predicted ATPase/DNA-binding SARP family transcriptional activator
MEFRILGPLEVHGEPGVIAPAPGKQRALLALLLLHRNEPVSAERLMLALWGEEAPPAAVKRLHVHVSRLRTALGDPELVTRTPAGYRLHVRPGELDSERFERLADKGRALLAAGEPDRAADALGEALALWRGPPLADVALQAFAQADIAQLEEQRLAALEARVAADLDLGRHAELVAELRRLVAEHPWRERLHAQLMLALYRTGRQADALDAYGRARQTLVAEIGAEPGPELRRLQQAILNQDPALELVPSADDLPRYVDQQRAAMDECERPMPVPRRAQDHGLPDGTGESAVPRAGVGSPWLPLRATPTLGREQDMARLSALVEDRQTRLITIVGPGGVGKTHLAVELVHALAGAFSDGAHFVSLAPLGRPQEVGSAIARALHLQLDPRHSVEQLLVQYCAQHELLLVLDNFEHVLDAADLVVDLLGGPEPKVVVTSRERLHVRAERVFALAPLAVSAPDSAAPPERGCAPAIELFTDVARASTPGFEVAPADLHLVREICWRLDGLPLAIELAAGSVNVLALPELAERVRQGLELPSRGPRDAPDRQLTLRATLKWSYDLLRPEEQSAFAALSVFAGGFRSSAADAVAGVELDVLQALVVKQLVTAAPIEHGLRFDMLATIRGFARERLDERRDARAVYGRHASHYLAFVERRAPELWRSGSRVVAVELEHEIDNLRAAFAWTIREEETEQALRLVIALAPYWAVRLDAEALTWFQDALALPASAGSTALRAEALARFALVDADRDRSVAEAAARASLELHEALGDAAGRGLSLLALAWTALQSQRLEAAFAHAHKAAELLCETDDPVLFNLALATAAFTAPTLAETTALAQRAIHGFQALGNCTAVSRSHLGLALKMMKSGECREAQQQVACARRAAEAAENDRELGLSYAFEGLVALFTDDPEHAGDAFVAWLDVSDKARITAHSPKMLAAVAMVAARAEQDVIAATLLGAVTRHIEAPDPVIDQYFRTHFVRPSRERLGRTRWDAAVTKGQRMSLLEAAALARQALATHRSVATGPSEPAV